MKALLLLLFAIAASACSADPAALSYQSKMLQGDWKLVHHCTIAPCGGVTVVPPRPGETWRFADGQATSDADTLSESVSPYRVELQDDGFRLVLEENTGHHQYYFAWQVLVVDHALFFFESLPNGTVESSMYQRLSKSGS